MNPNPLFSLSLIRKNSFADQKIIHIHRRFVHSSRPDRSWRITPMANCLSFKTKWPYQIYRSAYFMRRGQPTANMHVHRMNLLPNCSTRRQHFRPSTAGSLVANASNNMRKWYLGPCSWRTIKITWQSRTMASGLRRHWPNSCCR